MRRVMDHSKGEYHPEALRVKAMRDMGRAQRLCLGLVGWRKPSCLHADGLRTRSATRNCATETSVGTISLGKYGGSPGGDAFGCGIFHASGGYKARNATFSILRNAVLHSE
mmetsp:Transcript_6557/g.14912  ORF Transcript_6557/g.14912 Transcript_6557/m.14912 type:complete len:111 (+) Transcript_6557:422-754(+)